MRHAVSKIKQKAEEQGYSAEWCCPLEICCNENDNKDILSNSNSINNSAVANDTSKVTNFTSFKELQEAKRKHSRLVVGPQEILVKPLTAGQEYGWHYDEQKDVNGKEMSALLKARQNIHAKKSCPETIFASELMKNGIYF